MGLPIKKAENKFTYKDYCGWPDNERWELIEGVAYNMSPAPSINHQRIVRKLTVTIGTFLRGNKCEMFPAPFDVFFPDYEGQDLFEITTVVQPDISVVCDPGRLVERGCVGPPDLLIEILSPWTSKKDLSEKFRLYESSGVGEYWIVDPGNLYVQTFLLQPDGTYDSGTLYQQEGNASSSILDGFLLDVKELLNSSSHLS